MITPENSELERKLRSLVGIRTLLGIAVIIAVLAVALFGIDAFTKEKDAWLAMRLPLAMAVVLIWGFARTAKAIVTLQVARRR